MSITKVIIVLLLFTILFNLGSGLFHLIKDEPGSTGVVKSLTWRMGLSIALFLLIMLAGWLGLITPHGV
jgi:succinate dehydrogenase hydrophobic anchor subunit